MDDWRERVYAGYQGFKEWADDGGDQAEEIFEIEMRRAGLGPDGRVLELGFGSGAFLDWRRKTGRPAKGIEFNADLVQAAAARGLDVLQGDAVTMASGLDETFDLIVAFDVFEHLTMPEIADLLDALSPLLADGGVVLARFPNGASPFSAPIQNGDASHVTALSATRIDQIARLSGLRLRAAYNAARPLRSGRRSIVVRWIAYKARDLVEIAIGLIYFGRRMPLDPNVTVLLEKAP